MTRIRPATDGDIEAIGAIWNPLIRETDITFNPVEKTPEAIAAFLSDHARDGDPVLVLEDAGAVVGFAAYHPFRGGQGYARTKEVTISLAQSAQGAGYGKNLMQALEDIAKEADIHVLVAGITETNMRSRKFFAGLGYNHVGSMPQVGWKFDRWHNLVLMQKIL